MRTTRRRSLWIMLAGAVLTGWCSASLVSPPAAGTQSLPSGASARTVDPPIPPIALAMAVPRTPPTSQRNPFAFGSSAAATPANPTLAPPDADERSRAPVEASQIAATAAPPDPDTAWRLIGIATTDTGLTAIVAGPAGVQLVRVGDRLPSGRSVLELTDTALTLGGGDGPSLTLRLP